MAKEDVLEIYGYKTYMAFLLQTELKSVVHTFSKQMNNAKVREKFYADDTIIKNLILTIKISKFTLILSLLSQGMRRCKSLLMRLL